MKLFVTGGTGFVGRYVTRGLAQMGHHVTVVTRSAKKDRESPGGISLVEGDPTKPGLWQERVAEHDVIINLAGAPIFTYWTRKAKQNIVESRLLTTHNLVDALAESKKESLLLSTSAVGYYGGHEDDEMLDESSPAGDDFLAQVGLAWESEAMRAEEFGVRVVICRFGIVLGKNGGALSQMEAPFKKFLGSPLGSGKQWFPWIHERDLLNIMVFLAENSHIVGPVNCVSPNPVRNEELTRTLAKVLKKPLFMPSVPGFALRMILGEFGDVLLKGQRAIPRKLMDGKFQFQFPVLQGALDDLLS